MIIPLFPCFKINLETNVIRRPLNWSSIQDGEFKMSNENGNPYKNVLSEGDTNIQIMDKVINHKSYTFN